MRRHVQGLSRPLQGSGRIGRFGSRPGWVAGAGQEPSVARLGTPWACASVPSMGCFL